MHACGQDTYMAIILGVAALLKINPANIKVESRKSAHQH
jgi:metal-dependent amidase/aminoacylase/carboxypeptidase family protein